jgi:hypothetical protein
LRLGHPLALNFHIFVGLSLQALRNWTPYYFESLP